MNKIIKFINDINDLTYIFFIISIITAILVMLLSIYYTSEAHTFSNPIFYLRVGSELLIGAKDMIISAIVYSMVIEFMLRNK